MQTERTAVERPDDLGDAVPLTAEPGLESPH
jgi:hypothetical protein